MFDGHLNNSGSLMWGEEGAGGERSPPPAPSSPCERLRGEQSEGATTFEKPCCEKPGLFYSQL